MNDWLFAIRSLRKSPALSTVAIVTLALGIGANTAIFSVVKAVLLNPLPYRDAVRIVALAKTSPDAPDSQTVDAFTVEDWRSRSHSFQSIALYGDASSVLVDKGVGEIVRGLRVNWNFFPTLGVPMRLGRNFLPEEDRPDRRFTVVILSYGFWMRRFGGDPGIVGRVLDLGVFHYTVIGVLPASFAPLLHGTTELLPEIYMPAGIDFSAPCRRCAGPHAVARLNPGISAGQAGAELNTIMRDIVREHPDDYARNSGASVTPLREFLFGRVNAALWAVLAAAGLVLLIACANVAHLLLAPATARVKEMAVRTALGAGRWQLIRNLLAESLVLAMAGGAAGVLLACAGTGALASSLPWQIPRSADIRIDSGVLAFSAAAILATALLCGLAPACHTGRANLHEALQTSGKGSTASRSRAQRVLVMAELALAVVLVSGALLMSKSLARLTGVDPGYDPHNVLTLSSSLWGPGYENQETMLRYYQRTLERLRSTPGIEDAAWTSMLPLDAADRERLYVEEHPLARGSDAPVVETYSVSPNYFRVMKIPRRRGRVFGAQDTFSTVRVAVISEACARQLFPGEDPIGKHIQIGDRDPRQSWATVVGVVGDIRQYGLDRPPRGEVYFAQSQDVIIGYYRLVARTAVPPLRLEQPVRAAFQKVDAMLPVYHVKSMDDYLAGTLAARTVTLALLRLFGTLALVLAAAGIYGVISYTVATRTREAGIRMALGARARDVAALLVWQTLTPGAAGLAIGVAASQFLTGLLSSLLFEAHPADWETSAAAALVMAAVAALASYWPARRTAGVDPTIALREE